MDEPISYNSVSDALDYHLFAEEQVQESSPRMTKHVLAALADAVELLLQA